MLTNILKHLENDNTKLSLTTENDKVYILDKKYEFTKYALNVLLVLQGKRMAYGVDLHHNDHTSNQYYAQLARLIDKRLDIYLPHSYEPLIILKENYQIVDNIFKTNTNPYGKVLGYSYTGNNHVGLSVCDLYYGIHFCVTKEDDEYFLYSFNIPSVEYTKEIKDHILYTKDIFNDCLKEEGYEVLLKHGDQTKDNYVLNDDLPLV